MVLGYAFGIFTSLYDTNATSFGPPKRSSSPSTVWCSSNKRRHTLSQV